MNYVFRALKSLKERIGKTLIILSIMLAVCIVILVGFSIQSAADKAAIMARQKLGANVTLTVDRQKLMTKMQSEAKEAGGRIKPKMTPIPLTYLDELIKSKYIINYSVISSTGANLDGLTPVGTTETETTSDNKETKNQEKFNGKMPGMNRGDVTIVGLNNFSSYSGATSGDISMVLGRKITDEDLKANVVMVEETFAKENSLKVGSKIKLVNTSDETSTIEAEVVGIYKSSAEVNEMAYRMPSMLPYNQIYAPYTLANKFKDSTYENAVDSITFYLDDPVNVDKFIEEGKKTSIDFNTFTLDAGNQAYETMMGPIENVASFSKTALISVTIFGAAILALIIMLSIKDRINEIGILMSLGEKRGKIIAQFLVEVVLVLTLAIGISAISGNKISSVVSNKLVQNEVAVQKEEESKGRPQMGFNRNSFNSISKVQTIDKLNVSVNINDFGKMAGLSLILSMVATIIPSISIMRFNPKTILSKHN